MKKLTALEMLSALQSGDSLDPHMVRRLKQMMTGGGLKRGVTKKAFNKKKARARNKMQKASRQMNRGVNVGQGSSASYGGNVCHRV